MRTDVMQVVPFALGILLIVVVFVINGRLTKIEFKISSLEFEDINIETDIRILERKIEKRNAYIDRQVDEIRKRSMGTEARFERVNEELNQRMLYLEKPNFKKAVDMVEKMKKELKEESNESNRS